MLRAPEVSSPFAAGRRNQSVAALFAILAVMAALLMVGSAPGAIHRPPAGGHPGFSPVDAGPVQLVWPTVGTTVGLGASLTTAMGRVLETLGLNGIVTPVGAAGVLVALLAFAVARRLDCTILSATATALALSFSGHLWTHAAAVGPATLGALFSLATIGALLLAREVRRTAMTVIAAASYAMAILIHPSALGALPALLWAAPAGGLVPVALVGLAGALGGAGLLATIGGGAAVGAWFVPLSLASVVDRFGALPGALVTDFGVLGGMFLVLGAIRLTTHVGRFVLLLGWAMGVAVWTLVWAPAEGHFALMPMFVPLWLVAGVGMTWVQQLAVSRTARVGVAALVALLPVLSLLVHFDTGAKTRSFGEFADRYFDALVLAAPPDSVVLAESPFMDRVAVASQSGRTPAAPGRVPQTVAGALQALTDGAAVVGFAGAQASLQELGFRFEALADAGVPMSVAEVLETVPHGWIVAIAIGPQFPLSVMEDGPTFRTIGGTEPLFGRSRWHYGLVGVKRRGHRAIERSGFDAVDLEIKAAEPLAPDFRSPVSIRVLSSEQGGAIHYRGQAVASTQTGIALAIVSPTGDLEAVFDADYSRNLRILVNPPSFSAALLAGREPCVDTAPGRWTDVSSVAGLSSVGALMEPGQGLTLYLGSEHPLVPRQAPLRWGSALSLDVTAFDTAADSGLEALQGVLTDDGLGDLADRVLEAPYVYRLRVGGARTSREQLALRLGGFATTALARPDATAVTEPIALCSAMRATPGRPLIGAAGASDQFDVDLENGDLFVFGWEVVERAGSVRFRWTNAPRAEFLLPVARPEARSISIEAQPIAGPGTTLELRVNGTSFTPVVLDATPQEYRWEVPADSWQAGMNRVSIGVSRLARPSEVGASLDNRLLGVAVRRIRIVTEGPAGGQ